MQRRRIIPRKAMGTETQYRPQLFVDVLVHQGKLRYQHTLSDCCSDSSCLAGRKDTSISSCSDFSRCVRAEVRMSDWSAPSLQYRTVRGLLQKLRHSQD